MTLISCLHQVFIATEKKNEVALAHSALCINGHLLTKYPLFYQTWMLFNAFKSLA